MQVHFEMLIREDHPTMKGAWKTGTCLNLFRRAKQSRYQVRHFHDDTFDLATAALLFTAGSLLSDKVLQFHLLSFAERKESIDLS